MPKPQLWSTPNPEYASSSRVAKFILAVNQRYGTKLSSYWDLHRWSIEQPDQFWTEVWEQFGIVGQKGTPVLRHCHMENP
jgi:acetoacetyl-CoA synthetase